MKKILYLLCSCFAVTLMASCEDFLDKTPQGDKTDQDIFSRFNETESLINRLYFYARAADQPLVHIRFFSDSALTDKCEGSSAENGWSTSSTTATGNRVPSSTPRATPRPTPAPATPSGPRSIEDIRCANVILEGIEKYNTPGLARHAPARCRSVSARCYFLRAYLHYCVLKSYGECPYVDYTVDPNSTAAVRARERPLRSSRRSAATATRPMPAGPGAATWRSSSAAWRRAPAWR